MIDIIENQWPCQLVRIGLPLEVLFSSPIVVNLLLSRGTPLRQPAHRRQGDRRLYLDYKQSNKKEIGRLREASAATEAVNLILRSDETTFKIRRKSLLLSSKVSCRVSGYGPTTALPNGDLPGRRRKVK